jgi:hypothetical protein
MDIDAEITKLSPTEKDVLLFICPEGKSPDAQFERACQAIREKHGCTVIIISGASELRAEMMTVEAKRKLLNELEKSLVAKVVDCG